MRGAGDYTGLTPVAQVILETIHRHPGQFNRSELAKLLAGSRSSRIGNLIKHPDYGCLEGHSRKSLTTDIDILVDQGYLVRDARDRLVLAAR